MSSNSSLGATAVSSAHRSPSSFSDSITRLISPVVLPFVVSRALILVVAVLLQWALDSGRAYKYEYIGYTPLATLSSTFDANWYGDVAYNGYSTSTDVAASQNYHFFPLYPFFMRLAGDASGLGGLSDGDGYKLAGVVLSHLFFFVALVLLYQLTLQVSSNRTLALSSVWLMAAFPWSYVFSMTYTESLFLMLSLGTVLVAYLYRGRATPVAALAAGLLAALTTLTRPQGFILALVVVLFLAVLPEGLSSGARALNAVLSGAPAFLAFGGFALYLGARTGNLMALVDSSDGWGTGWYADLYRLAYLPPGNPYWPIDVIQLIALTTWVLLTVWILRQHFSREKASGGLFSGMALGPQRWVFVFYAAAFLGLTLVSNPAHGGWGRYLTVVFPCIWLVASTCRDAGRLRRMVQFCLALQVLLFAAAVFLQVTP